MIRIFCLIFCVPFVSGAAVLAGESLSTLSAPALLQFEKLSAEGKAFTRYLIVNPDAPTYDEAGEFAGFEVNWIAAMNFGVASTSREPNLNHQLPARVADRVYRIDLRRLGWDYHDFARVVENYPYSDRKNPLFIRADWLLKELSDQSERDSYLRLLVGGKNIPKTRDQALSLFEVDVQKVRRLKLDFGVIETKSSVAVQKGATDKTRVLEFIEHFGGYASGTKDYLQITPDNSPLDAVDPSKTRHDGEEWIIGVAKVWTHYKADGTIEGGRGALQAYFLSDGKGNVVTEAPAKLVEDHTKFAGVASIRFPGSCIACHPTGLNAPTQNGMKRLRELGVEIGAKDDAKKDFAERWHLTDSAKFIRRANEDFAGAVRFTTGLNPEDAVAEYTKAIDHYRADVTLPRAAKELYSTPEELSAAIAYASEAGIDVGAEASKLAHGEAISRASYESLYLRLQTFLDAWRESK